MVVAYVVEVPSTFKDVHSLTGALELIVIEVTLQCFDGTFSLLETIRVLGRN